MSGCNLYRFFDSAGRLLYVGVTNDFDRRMSKHSTAPWFDYVGSWTVDRYPSRLEAGVAEAEAIELENPKFNGKREPADGTGALRRERQLTRQLVVRLDLETLHMLEEQAELEDRTVSAMARILLARGRAREEEEARERDGGSGKDVR